MPTFGFSNQVFIVTLSMRTIISLVIRRLQKIGYEHKRIARGLLLVAIFMLAGKIVGAAKEIAIAYRFGLSEIVDVYVLAFTFAVWIPVAATTVLNSIYITLVHKLDKTDKDAFTRQFTGLGFVVSGVLTLFLLVALPWMMDLMSGQFSTEARLSLRKLAIGFAPIAGLGFLTALFSSMLLAEEKHANTLFEVIPSLTIVVLVLIWPNHQSINPLLWGTLIGFGLQAAGLYLLLLQSKLFKAPQLSFNSPGWLRFKQDIGIVFIGQFAMSFIEPISSVIAAELGPGNVSGLGYSNRILALFLTLGGTTIARAILPVLSKNQNQEKTQIRLGVQWSLIMLIAGVICATITWILAPQIVKLLLERGAFNADNTATISNAVRLGVIQFPFFFSGIVLAQLFMSLRLYKFVMVSSFIAVVVKVIFSLLLVRHYEFAGIVLANVPMYAATNIFFFFALWKIRDRATHHLS